MILHEISHFLSIMVDEKCTLMFSAFMRTQRFVLEWVCVCFKFLDKANETIKKTH